MTIHFFKNLYKAFALTPQLYNPIRVLSSWRRAGSSEDAKHLSSLKSKCFLLSKGSWILAFARMTSKELEKKVYSKQMYGLIFLVSFLSSSLYALSPDHEVKACKTALLAQLNERKKLKVHGCPVGQKLVYWLGILRNPEQFTPKELLTFLNTHSHWPHHEKLCQKAEEVIQKKGSTQEILRWFDQHPPQTPMGAIAYGKALLSHKEKAKAERVIRNAWSTMELSREEEKKFLHHFTRLLRSTDHTGRLHFLLMNECKDAAKRLLIHLPVSMRKIAEVRLAFLNDQSPLQKMTSLPAKLRQMEGLLYEKIKWCRKQKDYKTAAIILIKTPSNKIYANLWWKERSYITREFMALGQYQLAYKILLGHHLKPGTEQYAEAEWLAGWIALRFLNQPKTAQRHFESLYASTKGAMSKARAAYWKGRVHESQNEIILAEKSYRMAAKYKTIYYGQLAAAKLQEKPHPILATVPKISAKEKKQFEQKELVTAARILKHLGKSASHELSKFLLHIADQSKTKGERELAVHLAHDLSPHDVVWAAKKAGHRDPVLLKKAYPTCVIPRKGQKIPEEALVMAVAYQESRFNPTAVSEDGAMGLLQVLPSTAAKEAKRLGVHHTKDKLFNPQHNLMIGVAHISKLLKDFGNSYILMLAAYNAGSTPVKRWLEEIGDPRKGEIDIIDWVELIPYYETRNYVMRVLENITNYRSLKANVKETLVHDLMRGQGQS